MKIFRGHITTLIAIFLFSISCYAIDDEDHVDLQKNNKETEEVNDQENALSGKMDREDAVTPLGDIQEAWDHADEDAGIYRVKFNPHKVIRLNLRQGTITMIMFPEWEEIDNYILGDSVAFHAQKIKKNILMVYPKYAGADTNLSAIGEVSKTPYTFYMRSGGIHDEKTSDFTVFIDADPPLNAISNYEDKQQEKNDLKNGRLPRKLVKKIEEEITSLDKDTAMELVRIGSSSEGGYEQEDFLVELKTARENLDFNYTMHGEKSISPKYVFNDGLFTYLYWGNDWHNKKLPAVREVLDGMDRLINQRVIGTMVVVESLGDFSLTNTGRFACIKQKK